MACGCKPFYLIAIEGGEMTKTFSSVAEYFDQLQKVESDGLGWPALRMVMAREAANDLIFTNTDKNTITLELTGTASHFTSMDGICDSRRTAPDDVCSIPAGIEARFSWTIFAPSQCSVLVEFDETLFTHYAPEIVTDKFLMGHLRPRNYSPDAGTAALIRMLARELDPELRRGRLFAETAIRLLAIEVASTTWTRIPPPMPDECRYDPRIRGAIGYIECNYPGDISLQDLCAVSGLGATRLIKLFQTATGQTPYAFVIMRRVRQAVHLLRTTRLPIAHVALESGFSDQQHMTRLFRQYLCQTPGSFRGGC